MGDQQVARRTGILGRDLEALPRDRDRLQPPLVALAGLGNEQPREVVGRDSDRLSRKARRFSLRHVGEREESALAS